MFAISVAVCLSLAAVSAADDVQTVEAAAAKSLATVPGASGFVFAEITDSGVTKLYGINAEKEFAVGSSFKLYILGTLIDEVNAHRRQLTDTMPLQRKLEGPPSSEMGEWPVGLPVTVGTLALKMIWISDNTATDHLLHLLGREQVESEMAAMGHSNPAVNKPLLSTREMTMLRDKQQNLPGEAYRKLDDARRRAFLRDLTQEAPDYEKLDFDTAAYDVAEWYASPLDMAKAMAWIYHHTGEEQPAHLLRAVLTVDAKLPYDPKVWPFVGFKGGSEDQLIAGNWLMKNRNGKWYTLHIFFNNPDGPVEPAKVLPAMEGILKAIEPTLE